MLPFTLLFALPFTLLFILLFTPISTLVLDRVARRISRLSAAGRGAANRPL